MSLALVHRSYSLIQCGAWRGPFAATEPRRYGETAARRPVAAVPTLAEVVVDPNVLDGLPVEALIALRQQIRHLDVNLDAEITRRLAPGPAAQSTATGRLLTVTEMMALGQLTRRWLYRHADSLPFTRRLSKKALRFDEAGARRWLASRRP